MKTRLPFPIPPLPGNCRRVLLLLAVIGLSPATRADWIAYNDSAYKSGQTNGPNVTTFGLGRSFAGEGSSGRLKSVATGEDTPVTATYEEHFSTGSVNSAGDVADYPPGSDAEAEFKGQVDLSGNMSYGDSPGWYVDLILTGLDPGKRYIFAGTAHRNGGPGYAERVTNWTILGAGSATYASSAGATKVSNESVEFSTGDNAAGLVARWVEIDPGSDGRIVIRTSHTVGQASGGMPGAHAYKGYAGGVFTLKEGPYRWRAFNDSAFKPGQTNDPNVTTFGLGRSFAGEGSSGLLKEVAAGAATAVTATYTETITTGSVNSAGDAAEYPPGSDAESLFKGVVDLAGNMSYGDSPGWYVDLTLSGMDPMKKYTFAATANRNGGAAYADRVTNWTLIGAKASSYASSAAAWKISNDSVEFSTGENAAGLIARWTDIDPGADGTIVIRTSHSVGQANGGLPGAHAYKGYAGGVFLLAEQFLAGAAAVSKPIDISSVLPADGAAEVSPSSPVQIVLKPGDRGVNTASISLKIDSVTVTPTITTEQGTTRVSYTPPSAFAASSVHTVRIDFTDDGPTPVAYTRTWSFTVIDSSGFPVLPAEQALPMDPSRYTRRGFAMNVVSPDPNDGIPLATVDDAEAIWGLPYNNLVEPSVFNALGYALEPASINYQVDGSPIGNMADDRPFPGIPGRGQPGEAFAIQIFTLLQLAPGHHRFNITMQPGFRLLAGSATAEVELPAVFSPCTNCGGDDAPWIVDFMVEREGLYPFRLLFYGGSGSSSLEWVSVTPAGQRFLVNDLQPGAIAAYIPPDTAGPSAAPTIVTEGNRVVISWTGAATLQSSPDLRSGRWTNVNGAGSPHRVTPSGTLFYRLVR